MSSVDDINDIFPNDFETVDEPSYTYKMVLPKRDDDVTKISGMTDEVEAVQQAVYKILNTERYTYPIYTWDYGIELRDLFGKPIPWVYPELERRITEALTWDDRITSVTEFEFDNVKNSVHAKFTVNTIFGSFEAETVVGI